MSKTGFGRQGNDRLRERWNRNEPERLERMEEKRLKRKKLEAMQAKKKPPVK